MASAAANSTRDGFAHRPNADDRNTSSDYDSEFPDLTFESVPKTNPKKKLSTESVRKLGNDITELKDEFAAFKKEIRALHAEVGHQSFELEIIQLREDITALIHQESLAAKAALLGKVGQDDFQQLQQQFNRFVERVESRAEDEHRELAFKRLREEVTHTHEVFIGKIGDDLQQLFREIDDKVDQQAFRYLCQHVENKVSWEALAHLRQEGWARVGHAAVEDTVRREAFEQLCQDVKNKVSRQAFEHLRQEFWDQAEDKVSLRTFRRFESEVNLQWSLDCFRQTCQDFKAKVRLSRGRLRRNVRGMVGSAASKESSTRRCRKVNFLES